MPSPAYRPTGPSKADIAIAVIIVVGLSIAAALIGTGVAPR